MKKKGTIYMIVFPNGKKYIGQTQNFKFRKWHHENDSFNNNLKQYNYPVCRAIRKYGTEDLHWKILYHDVLLSDLDRLEREEIFNHDSMKNGYNCTTGGSCLRGYKHSRDIREKMSKDRSGSGNTMYGKKHSKETKKLISEKALGRHVGEKSPNTKLTWEDVNKMRSEYECGNKTIKELSIEYNMHYSSVKNILYYKRWKI